MKKQDLTNWMIFEIVDKAPVAVASTLMGPACTNDSPISSFIIQKRLI